MKFANSSRGKGDYKKIGFVLTLHFLEGNRLRNEPMRFVENLRNGREEELTAKQRTFLTSRTGGEGKVRGKAVGAIGCKKKETLPRGEVGNVGKKRLHENRSTNGRSRVERVSSIRKGRGGERKGGAKFGEGASGKDGCSPV